MMPIDFFDAMEADRWNIVQSSNGAEETFFGNVAELYAWRSNYGARSAPFLVVMPAV